MSKCGIGLAVRLAANGMFQVEDMTPNTPSQLCGFFKKGDLITAVDGNSVIGFTMDQFVDAVLGVPGSDITVLPALDPFLKPLSARLNAFAGCDSTQKSRRPLCRRRSPVTHSATRPTKDRQRTQPNAGACAVPPAFFPCTP